MVQDFSQIFTIQNVTIYLVIINLIGFFTMWLDKRKAKRGEWRIPEQTLLIITLIGGGIGSIIAMYKFRHKTKKLRFTIGFPIIIVVQVIIVCYYLIFMK